MIKTIVFPGINFLTPECSICKCENIYFECSDECSEMVNFQGKEYEVHHIEFKRYCKECFEEYGGSEEIYV